MSKRVRTLLLSGVAVFVLTALLVVVLLIPAPDTGDTTTTTTAEEKVTVWSKSGNDKDGKSIEVQSVSVAFGDESYTLVTDKDGNMVLEQYPELPHDNGSIVTLTSQLMKVEAIRLIDNAPAQPEKYGFGGEVVTVSATYTDGTSFAFEIADENPDATGRYLRNKANGAVYLYDAKQAETFSLTGIQYLTKAPMVSPETHKEEEAASDTVVLRDAELSGSVRPSPIYYHVSSEPIVEGGVEASSTGYFIQRPYFRGVKMNSTLLDTVAYSNLYIDSVEAVYPTAQQLKDYGLDTPYSQCTVTFAARHDTVTKNENDKTVTTHSYYNALEYTVKIGNEVGNGLRYAVVYEENKLFPVVYRVQAKNIEWCETQYDDVADSLLFYTYIVKVQDVTITADGKTTKFDLKHSINDEGNNHLVVKAGSKTYDADDFRNLYQSMMSLQRLSATSDKPNGEAVFALKITPNTDTVPATDVKIYPYSGSKYLAAHASGETYLIDAKAMEPFLKKYQEFLED